MSISQIIVLTAVIGAFVLFAVALAWGDYPARQTARRTREKETAPTPSVVSFVREPARWPQGPEDHLQHVA